MKRFVLHLFVLITFLLGTAINTLQAQDNVELNREDSAFMARVKALPGVVDMTKIPVTGKWEGKYKIQFLQELDHKNPNAGYFLQSLYLNHKDFERPMVVVTEGYGAAYGEIPMYQTEIAGIVDGNQLIIEHRYFRESVPENMNWDYLTVANAATDQHAVIESFKTLYDRQWISTGISKGGQTVMFHKSLYPDDVDFSIPYVCPLNFGVEDGRHEDYIAKTGKRSDRKAIKAFQLEVLRRKDSLMPLLYKFIRDNELVYRIPEEEVFDLCVLEYSFAFWQWLADADKIPGRDASNEELFSHLMAVASADYFAESDYFLPFFVQAAREIGYYGYDTDDFEDYLSLPTAEGYLYRVFLPDSLHYEYDAGVMEAVQDYFEKNDPKMIFIYGEYDPWTASGIEFSGKENMIKIIKEGGTHATRISNLPEEQHKMVIAQIKEWLEQE